MKNRTVYEVLDSVMENYSYTIEKEGKKISLTGKVYISKIDVSVTHEKTIYQQGNSNDNYKLENAINTFKEELRNKVAEIIKSHAEELTDDEAMIDKLQYEIKSLRKTVKELEEELDEAKAKISALELEKLTREPIINPATPYPNPWTPGTTPWDNPNPWSTGTTPWNNPNPWSTGITWEAQIGDPPGWMDKNNITCSTGDGNTNTTYGNDNEVIFHTSEYKKRGPKRFGL